MGLLIDGVWRDQWYDTSKSGGRFVRSTAGFRNWVTPDGSAGPTGKGGFRAEPGRYHLYIARACPWAHRTMIFRALKGLEGIIDYSVVHWRMLENGWTFEPGPGVTGDLVNLALDGEIEMARHWLETLGPPEDVSVVPGNHDAYVPGALDKACRAWAAWMTGDGVNSPVDRNSFPYLRVRGKVALIGVSTARATAPFMANGFFMEGQAKRLGRMLDATAGRGLFRVVMIHHPPLRGAVPQHKRLFGIDRFAKLMRRHGAELILHGHSHLPTLSLMDGRDATIPVVGVAAAGQAPGGKHPAAQYNLLGIDGEPANWRITLTQRGLTGPATQPTDLETLELGVAGDLVTA